MILNSKTNKTLFVINFLAYINNLTPSFLVNAPWYVTNQTIHYDLGVRFVYEEIHRLSSDYHSMFSGNDNQFMSHLATTLED